MLVGEDSLEANVGHLAALSGGDIFVAANSELADVLEAAMRSLRSDHVATTPITGKPQHVMVRRAGMTFTAQWQQPAATGEATIESRAVAALAASLALPALDAEGAAALAKSEGLVTHLTSLVLVDDAGAVQEGLPGARKVLLPAPRTAAMAMPVDFMPLAEDAPMRSRAMMRRMSPAPSGRASESQGRRAAVAIPRAARSLRIYREDRLGQRTGGAAGRGSLVAQLQCCGRDPHGGDGEASA